MFFYNKNNLSNKITLLTQSEIRNMSIECDRIGGINLSQGISNLPLSSFIKDGAITAIEEGINYYTRYDGVEELRKVIAIKSARYNDISCDPDKNIVVSAGATGAFYCACLALLNSGDEVIIFEPYYGYHINTLYAAEAVPVYVKMSPPEWSFTIKDLEAVVTPRTKAIMINTPSNPSGKVFTLDELELLGDFCEKHNLFVFTDEIYEYFLYDGKKHISPASLEKFKDRTITISGYSKTFSITGWRVGYCIVPEALHDAIGYVNDLVYVCSPSPLQYGVAKGISELNNDFYFSIQERFHKKRDLLCSVLDEAGLKPYSPSGAYYILSDVSNVPGISSKEKSMFILNECKVASVPGMAFYHDNGGENIVRFCFAKEEDELLKACEQLLKIKL
jgi:aminotransferase